MGLVLPQTVEVNLMSSSIQHYESMGYHIERLEDSQGRPRVPKGTKLVVDVCHLPRRSNTNVLVKCDICGKERQLSYSKYVLNIERNCGKYICADKSAHKSVLDNELWTVLPSILQDFLLKNGRFPTAYEMRKENGLISYGRAESLAAEHGTSLQEIMADINCFKTVKPSLKHYDEYCSEYKRRMLANGSLVGMYTVWDESSKNVDGLPRPDWMVENAPAGSGVFDIESWMLWAGFDYTRGSITKDIAAKLILEKAEKCNGVLFYDDFRNPKYGDVSINQIRNIWGTVNNMKRELGLPIIQESMLDKQLSHDVVLSQVVEACTDIYQREHRTVLTIDDLERSTLCQSASTIRKAAKSKGFHTVSDFIKSIGFDLVKPGRGLVHTFPDGEIVYSRFELIFSNFLRSNGLIYQKDYLRSVRYSEFSSCGKRSDCDYVIRFNGRNIYVEIAGVLGEYKTWFWSGRVIESSRSKEKYRKSLDYKRSLLEQIHAEYFILFPCDLNDKMMSAVLNEDYLTAREIIDNHYKNNIQWSRIPLGEGVKYNFQAMGRDKNASVVYANEEVNSYEKDCSDGRL